MILYELNQSGYANLPKMTKAEIQKAKESFQEADIIASKYFALICNELRYYTLFCNKRNCPYWHEQVFDEVVSLLQELGELKSIEVNEQMVEFWVAKDGECHMYALFNYDRGVIEL